MSRNQLFLVLCLLYIAKGPLSTSTYLIRRQDGDSLWNANWGGALETGVTTVGALGSAFLNLFQDPNPSELSTIAPPETGTESTSTSPETTFSEPLYNPDTPPSVQASSFPAPPPLAQQCDDPNIVGDDCGKALDQVILTSSCAEMLAKQVATSVMRAQNQAIWDKLISMAPGRVRKSVSNLCDVYLFVAPLTWEQSQEISLRTPGVRAVVSSIIIKSGGFSQKGETPVAEPATLKRDLAKHRSIQRDTDASQNLKFISTPASQSRLANAYSYDAAAGEGTVVFLLCDGVAVSHHEFTAERQAIREFFYGLDASRAATTSVDGHGTCLASLITSFYGVAKKTELIIVKIIDRLYSLIDGLVQILNYLHNEVVVRQQPAKGYVLLIEYSWYDIEPNELTHTFTLLVEELRDDYQVVLVYAAGEDYTGSRGLIEAYPALLAGDKSTIAVGAVDIRGLAYPWSRTGGLLTTHAPGAVLCASNDGGSGFARELGTNFAAAQVAGLAAYFLSLPDTGYLLRQDPLGVPVAVKALIVQHAYARTREGDLAIWNLLGDRLPVSRDNGADNGADNNI